MDLSNEMEMYSFHTYLIGPENKIWGGEADVHKQNNSIPKKNRIIGVASNM